MKKFVKIRKSYQWSVEANLGSPSVRHLREVDFPYFVKIEIVFYIYIYSLHSTW